MKFLAQRWSIISGLWYICGDFNVVLNVDERIGSHSSYNSMMEFNDFVVSVGVLDDTWNKFTWCKREHGV